MAGIKRQKRFPIGYRIQNGRAEVVPEEAELVQRIFRDYLEGSTTYGIAKWMTELGVLNANGHPSWSHASIGNLLKNPRYCGDEYYPPIISKELFLQVQERRENRTSQLGRRYHPNSHAGKGILNGKIFCGTCGLEYRKYAKKRKKPGEDKWCWKCSKYQNGRKVSCGNRILSEEQIKNAALTAMNLVVEHPELAQEVQKESAAVETPKYRKLTRQIEELLQMEEFSAEEIKTLLYERAMEQYQSAEIESRAYYGRKIEEILCRGGKQEYFNEKCFQKTVEKIMVFKNGTMDVHRIKRILESEGIRTVTGNTVWQATVIDKMLTNEKYMGDALLQKTYTVDFLTKKKVVNKGIVPQYYIEDDHEAIIPKELFYRVQEEKARRGNIYRAAIKKKRGEEKSKYSGKYALSGLMICAECGQPYRRQVWSKYGKKSAVWRCDNRLKHGSERCKNSPTLKEEILHEAIMMAIGKVVEDQGEFVQAFRENVIRIIGSYGNKAKPTEYNTEIQELEKHLMSLIEESAKGNCGEEDFDREYRRVTAHLKELRKRKEQSRKEQRLAEAYDQRAGEVDDYIRKAGVLSREFDNDLVWRLIQTVKVINQNKIELQFRSGIVMVQRLDKWEN